MSRVASGLCVLFLMTGLAAVGFADDYIKIFKQRSTGLRARTKLVGQAAVSLAFAVLVLQYPDNHGLLVSTAAQAPTPAGFDNHGAYVRTVAQANHGHDQSAAARTKHAPKTKSH